ncbi:MAG TPA: DUF2752 domain-containing protein [Chthoniobacterales bacterium]|nr:DUF2752 domain-containing protein [Chthoniobacterales bacterium]
MQVFWRPLAPRELDRELLWLGVTIGGLVCATVWFALGLPWPVCWFHELTGHPCATCGATRAAIALFHGQLLSALLWNPMAFLIYCAIGIFDVYALAVLIVRRRRLRAWFSLSEKRILRVSAVAILLLNWAYLLAHSSLFNG